MKLSKRTEKAAEKAQEILDRYLQDKYSNQKAIQIFTDRTKQEDKTVAAAYVKTHPDSRERKYY
jgi:hypothetical protein